MRLWRLSKRKHATTALDGEGARIVGGRWSSLGTRAVYLSEHLSLAVLEVLVHTSKGNLPDHVAIEVEVPDDVAIYTPTLTQLPPSWRDPDSPQSTRDFGDAWLERGQEALMRVPSVIIPEEMNYILNPAHADATRIMRRGDSRFTFDPRLMKQ